MFTEHENVEHAFGSGPSYVPGSNRDYDPRTYIMVIDNFVETGELPPGFVGSDNSLTFDVGDPMFRYLFKIMIEPNVQARVLSSKIMALAFRDTMVEFIINVCQRVRYNHMRASGEMNRAENTKNWSMQKRQQGTDALLQQLDEEHRKDGFNKDFFEKLFTKHGVGDEDIWNKMCEDWKQSIQNDLKEKAEEAAKARVASLEKHLAGNLDRVKKQQESIGADDLQAIQAWKMMNGQWTETEFEKAMNIVKIQNKYPEIAEVCRRMGRVVNEQDKDLMQVATGTKFKIEHSTGSDIEGVTMGNDFNALLSHEVVQFSDNDLEDLFYQRFVTKKLQMFRYKSEMAKPSRKLNWKHASRKGPMIACVDSSASMSGVPMKIASSLLGRLEVTAEMLKRDCYLIDFSVDIRAIDLKERFKEFRLNSLGLKSKEENFSGGLFPILNGGTDARKMLERTFQLLESNPRYQNADVLWITDFLIPLPDKSQLQRLQQYRKSGTRFYGFQIGIEPTEWDKYMDKIYKIYYKIPSRF